MKNSKKAMLAGVTATAASIGYMVKKKRERNNSPYRRFMNKLEDYLD